MGEGQSKGPEQPAVREGSGDVAAGTAADQTTIPGDALRNEAPGTLLKEHEQPQESMPSESEILAKLVTHLSQCEGRQTPLVDIRARLPPMLHRATEDTAKLGAWLARFEGLIQIIGEPGSEFVRLNLDGGIKPPQQPAAVTPGKPTSVRDVPTPSTMAETPQQSTTNYDAIGGADDDDSLSACTVQLRGLPFRAQVNDIKTFLAHHAVHLSNKEPAIRLLLNRDGRPSGFARVQFSTPEAARACREDLHKQQMGDRYVEVLACSDRAGKARHRRAVATDAATESADAGGAELIMDSASEALERERVLQECRDHMRTPGRHTLLLSMLGIALSPQARTYLRRLNLGLKHFLARFPQEFRVEGPKGCEQVFWCPNGMAPETMGYDAMMQAAAMEAWTATAMTADMPASLPNLNHLMASPTPQGRLAPHLCDTPSDWGTPGPAGLPNPSSVANHDSSTQPSSSAATSNPALDPINPFNPWAAGAAFGFPPPWAGVGWPGVWQLQDGSEMDLGKGAGKGPQKQKSAPKSDATATRSHAHLHPQSHPFAHKPPAGGPDAAPGATVTAAAASTEAGANPNVAAVRLRGLPFSMSVQDVLAFFAQHDVVDLIMDGPQAAQLLPKANGRPSGQARVQMRSRVDAETAQQALNNQWIGGRYIEVFVYGDEPDGGNDGPAAADPKPAAAAAGGSANPWAAANPGFGGFPGASPGFPGGFGAVPPALWANSVLPPMPAAGAPGDHLDQLFSFLYEPKAGDGEGDSGAGDTDGAAPPQRNAVSV